MKRITWITITIGLLHLGIILSCEKHSNNATYTGVLEGTSIHVPALTGGKIVQILVDTGQEVTVGDTLAVLDTTELVLQHRQVQAALEELQVQEEIARTHLRRSKTDVDYIQEKYERIQRLYEQQAMPKQSLDDLGNQVQQAQSAYEVTRQQIRSLTARRKQLEAQIDTIRKKISDAVIIAPTNGLITTRYYEIGEAIPPLQPIVELMHIRDLEVKIYIPEKRLPEVKHGQEVKIRVDGLDEELPGRIRWVSPKAEFTPKTILTPDTRTALVYAVKITVPNPKRVLKHGMPVEVIW